MRLFLFVLLALLWILWMLPFFLGNRRHGSEQRIVTAKAARWGIALQGLSYAMVWGSQARFWILPLSLWRAIPALAIGAVSVVCAWVSVSNLGKQWRVDAGVNADHELVQSGPYRIVRHPIYASMLGMFLAGGLMLASWPVFFIALAIFIVGIEIRVRIEDSLLEERFQDSFRVWKSEVRAYVPLIR